MEIDGYINLDAVAKRILNNEKISINIFVLDTDPTV